MSAERAWVLAAATRVTVDSDVYLFGDDGVGKKTIKLLLEGGVDLFLAYVKDHSTGGGNTERKNPMNIIIPDSGELADTSKQGRKIVLVYVYSICNEKSLTSALSLCKRHKNSSMGKKISAQCLVGNKIDLEYWRSVSVAAGHRAALAGGAAFLEMSAHSGQHVDYLVDTVLRVCFPLLTDDDTARALQRTALEEGQDDQLQRVAEGVSKLKKASNAMASEMDSHARMLEDLERASHKRTVVAGREKFRLHDRGGKAGPPPPPAPQRSRPAMLPSPAPPAAEVHDHFGGLELSSMADIEMVAGLPSVDLQGALGGEEEEGGDAWGADDDHLMLSEIEAPPAAPSRSALQREQEAGDERFRSLAPPRRKLEKAAGRRGSSGREAARTSSEVRHSADLDRIVRDVEEVKNVMQENIDGLIDRSESMDIMKCAEELQMQAGVYKRSAFKLRRRSACRSCGRCAFMCLCGCPIGTAQFLHEQIKALLSKKALFDNVLADTENAFQALARCLAVLDDAASRSRTLLQKLLFGYWLSLTCQLSSFALVLSSALTLILPSFFTLLIVRTGNIEKESKAFGVRQEVIRVQKKEEALVRWVRIIVRSLPMTFYLLVLPFLLVYLVFPGASERLLTLCLVLYLSGIIALQVLGSVRAYYSWQTRDIKPPTPPELYVSVPEEVAAKKTCCGLLCGSCCRSGSAEGVVETRLEKAPAPTAPNTFDFKKPANWMELASLTLEFVQMASFALQRDPYGRSDGDNDDGATDDDAAADFWGKDLFQTVYVNLPVESDIQLALMWGSIGLVGLLLLLFTAQFLSELRVYGQLMKRVEDKDKAKDSFFFSFTGAIVYGHGAPANISERMRLVVGLLSDGLFLVISVQLLQVFACDYSEEGRPTLRVDDSMVCWEGRHSILATAALIAYAFYVPLSIMITPMLLEAPRQEADKGGTVTYLKLYLMSVNVTKSIMLLVAVLGPQRISTAIISSIVASFLLGTLTYAWFQSQDLLSSHYSAALQPCNIAFVNYWKAASYTAAVTTAVALVVAHALKESAFSPQLLTDVLIVAWTVIILTFAVLYYRYNKQHSERRAVVQELINYPFDIRDKKEADAGCLGPPPPPLIFRQGALFESGLKIPGSRESPWLDWRATLKPDGEPSYTKDCGGTTISGPIIRYQICSSGKKKISNKL